MSCQKPNISGFVDSWEQFTDSVRKLVMAMVNGGVTLVGEIYPKTVQGLTNHAQKFTYQLCKPGGT